MTNNEAERNIGEDKMMSFYSYAWRVRRLYQLGNPEIKSEILNRLEVIVQEFDIQPSTSQFDASKAKEIRIRKGLTIQELARITSVDQTYIGYWESGKRTPSPINRSNDVRINKGTIGYLLWLKQEGYNPFSLKEGEE